VPAAALPWLHVDGNEILDPNDNTVILRGVAMIDLGATESWEGGVKNMIDRLTKVDDPQGNSPGWATKVVRLMVGPKDGDSQTPIQYEPGGNYYERLLRPAVDYARGKGLYAIIDWHYIDTTSKHVDTTTEFWADMAPRFAGDSNVLFELYNEPINAGSWSTVRTDMQSWYDTVRAAAPKNLVLVGTPTWSQLVGDAAADPLDATNVAYVAHMYPQHWPNQSLRKQISDAAAVVPVFMTEWGFRDDPTNGITNGTITSYGDPIKAFMEEQHVSWTAWCASSSWGPPMFNVDYTLRVGEGEMGGFVKDWLYEKRDDDLAAP
jgi:endoglucanase